MDVLVGWFTLSVGARVYKLSFPHLVVSVNRKVELKSESKLMKNNAMHTSHEINNTNNRYSFQIFNTKYLLNLSF